MKVLKLFWRYWVWLCVALCTTAVLLFLVATIVHQFKPSSAAHEEGAACLESGGAWDAGAGECHFSS